MRLKQWRRRALLCQQWPRRAWRARLGRFYDSSDRENSYFSTFLGAVDYRGGAIDFYERLARKRGDGNTGAGRATVRKISFKDFVEAVVVVEFGKENGELQNAVHGAAAGFDESFDVFHDHAGVHLYVGLLAGVRIVTTRMCALTGNINDAVVNDQRSDEAGAFGGLAFVVELFDGVLIFR